MNHEADPFENHPALRDKIGDPLKSFFRTFRPSDLDEKMNALGLPSSWRNSDSEIEDSRRACLAGRLDQDLWVFAYGSLMWDPAFRFVEVRRGRLIGFARRFCLRDVLGGRGTREAPGLMAALDKGPGCDGLAFRISKDHVEEETAILWRRELLAPAYKPVFAEVRISIAPITALAFIADHASEMICPEMTRSEQVHYLATGTGSLGTSLEYVEKLASHFAALGIEDDEVTALLAEAKAYADQLRR